LSEGGVYCQWFHQYETDDEVVELVFRTFSTVFDHVAVWGTQRKDILILGLMKPDVLSNLDRLEERFERPDIKAAFRREGVSSFPVLLSKELLPLGVIQNGVPEGDIHTLYYPILNHRAGRAFFGGESSEIPFTGYGEAARLGAKNSLLRHYTESQGGTLPDNVRAEVILEACETHHWRCQSLVAEWMSEDPDSRRFPRLLDRIQSWARVGLWTDMDGTPAQDHDLRTMASFFRESRSGLGDDEFVSLDEAKRATELYQRFYHHAAPFPKQGLINLWTNCRDQARDTASCERQIGLSPGSKPNRKQERKIRECRRELQFGDACRAGLERARKLTDSGPIDATRGL
jgi:hypothetical protein